MDSVILRLVHIMPLLIYVFNRSWYHNRYQLIFHSEYGFLSLHAHKLFDRYKTLNLQSFSRI